MVQLSTSVWRALYVTSGLAGSGRHRGTRGFQLSIFQHILSHCLRIAVRAPWAMRNPQTAKVQMQAEWAPVSDTFWRVSACMKSQVKRPRGPLSTFQLWPSHHQGKGRLREMLGSVCNIKNHSWARNCFLSSKLSRPPREHPYLSPARCSGLTLVSKSQTSDFSYSFPSRD